jgi:hypothetical protein
LSYTLKEIKILKHVEDDEDDLSTSPSTAKNIERKRVKMV